MQRFLKGAIIGAVVGGGVAGVQAANRTPEAAEAGDATGFLVARGAATGALGGSVIGLFLDRRSRSKAQKLADQGAARGRRLARQARPKLDQARDTVSHQLHDAGQVVATTVVPGVVAAAGKAVDVIGGVIGDAVDAGRPAMADAVAAGREAFTEAIDAGRPKLADALASGRSGFVDAAHGARPGLESAVDATRERVTALAS